MKGEAMIAELLNRFEPEPVGLLREISKHISDDMLMEIAAADYGQDIEKHLATLVEDSQAAFSMAYVDDCFSGELKSPPMSSTSEKLDLALEILKGKGHEIGPASVKAPNGDIVIPVDYVYRTPDEICEMAGWPDVP